MMKRLSSVVVAAAVLVLATPLVATANGDVILTSFIQCNPQGVVKNVDICPAVGQGPCLDLPGLGPDDKVPCARAVSSAWLILYEGCGNLGTGLIELLNGGNMVQGPQGTTHIFTGVCGEF